MNVLESLRSRVAGRRRTARERVGAAAAKAAANEAIDVGDLDSALTECGQTVDDFAMLVELARKRAGWRADLAKHDAAAAAHKQHAGELAALELERTQWLEDWQTRAAAAHTASNAAAAIVARANAGRNSLVDPANVPEPTAQLLRDAADAVQVSHVDISRINGDLRHWRDVQQAHTGHAEHKTSLNKVINGMSGDDHATRAKRAANRIAELDAELAAARATLGEREAELAKLQTAALKL